RRSAARQRGRSRRTPSEPRNWWSSEKGEEEWRKRQGRQMPNETHLKRLISDAHNTHGRQAAGDRLHISREDSRIIASAVFDALRRANVLLIDQPGHSNPEA